MHFLLVVLTSFQARASLLGAFPGGKGSKAAGKQRATAPADAKTERAAASAAGGAAEAMAALRERGEKLQELGKKVTQPFPPPFLQPVLCLPLAASEPSLCV